MLKKYPSIKNILAFIAKATYVGVMVLGVVVLAVFITVARAERASYPRTFTVQGKASKYVAPDTLNISLSTVVKDESARKVQSEASEIVTDVVGALKELGIEEKDIRTGNYRISPEYKYDSETGEQSIYGYSTTITVEIKTDQKDLASDILDTVTENGINQVNSVSFSLEKVDEIKEELKLDAIEKAKENAQVQAKAAGLNLGKVVDLSAGDVYHPYYEKGYGFGESEVMVDEVAPSEPISVPVNEGEMEVEVEVTLVYEIK
jgi:hypothetical protein